MCRLNSTKKDCQSFGFGPTSSETTIFQSNCDGGARPSRLTTFNTTAILTLILVLLEQLFVLIADYSKGLHPILDDEGNRHKFARHIGVNTIGLLYVTYLAYASRHLLLSSIFIIGDDGINFASLYKLDPNRSFSRIYSHVPQSHYILTCFLAYQIKNTYDSWVWNDGILLMIHHALALCATWAGLYPGVAQIYGVFFMGVSEMSTVSLCLLATFDDDLGLTGMAEAFPTAKLVIGAVFVVTFIIFRILLWPIFTYHILNDTKLVLERDSEKLSFSSKVAIFAIVRSCQALTFMQVLFLGQIFWMGYLEISKML